MKAKNLLLVLLLLVLVAGLGVILVYRFLETEKPSIKATSASDVETPSLSPKPTETPSPTPAPTPEPYADKPEIDLEAWELTLANGSTPLGEDFIPLVTSLENDQSFDSRAVSALEEFIAAARAEGLSVLLTSSYRSYAIQQSLFNNKVNEYIHSEGSQEAATLKAKTIVAEPGTSEHQLGLAVDIVDKYYEYMNETLELTELSKWMKANCAEYGFILRYPKGRSDVTGVMFEPWHYRYVGKTAATYIMANDLTLEEFLALYK